MKEGREYLFYGLLIIGFLILFGRLFELQIIKGEKNRTLADGNRIRKVVIRAPRGIIYDRRSNQLVRNIPLYRKCPPGAELDKNCPITTREEALALELKGEEVQVEIGREYLYGKALAHVLGYLGEASEEEVKMGKRKSGDWLGRTGVEERYDDWLRGQDGGELFEADASGAKIRQMGKIDPIPGKDLYLNIDAKLSKLAYEALGARPGAVVASDPSSGQVLVLTSSPSFDPNKEISFWLNDPDKPFFNRAIGGLYPPGSTFKIVTAVAGLQEGKIDRETLIEDSGQIRVGEFTYNNWYFTAYGKTEGKINIVRAIKRSTDTFFYKLGEWLGPEKLAEWGRRFGLGEVTGIDMPGEAAGLVPDPEWKIKTTGEKWFLGNTYHFSIGQADLLTTPLQVNMMTSVIANKGRLCQPYLAQDTSEAPPNRRGGVAPRSGDSSEVEGSRNVCKDLGLKQETIDLVKEGMREACSPGGTAFPFFDFHPPGLPTKKSQPEPYMNSIEKASAKARWVACKTGTAEFGDPQGRTHAWLTAFAPVDNPEIVVTVLVEGGGEGSSVAAPIAKKVIEEWFGR